MVRIASTYLHNRRRRVHDVLPDRRCRSVGEAAASSLDADRAGDVDRRNEARHDAVAGVSRVGEHGLRCSACAMVGSRQSRSRRAGDGEPVPGITSSRSTSMPARRTARREVQARHAVEVEDGQEHSPRVDEAGRQAGVPYGPGQYVDRRRRIRPVLWKRHWPALHAVQLVGRRRDRESPALHRARLLPRDTADRSGSRQAMRSRS